MDDFKDYAEAYDDITELDLKNKAEPLVDIFAAAEYLGVQPNTIRVWCLEKNPKKRIPYRRVCSRYRFKISELEKWSEIIE